MYTRGSSMDADVNLSVPLPPTALSVHARLQIGTHSRHGRLATVTIGTASSAGCAGTDALQRYVRRVQKVVHLFLNIS